MNRDIDHELGDFTTPPATGVRPVADVQARAGEIRRRRHALLGGGAVVALVLVLGAVALAASGPDDPPGGQIDLVGEPEGEPDTTLPPATTPEDSGSPTAVESGLVLHGLPLEEYRPTPEQADRCRDVFDVASQDGHQRLLGLDADDRQVYAIQSVETDPAEDGSDRYVLALWIGPDDPDGPGIDLDGGEAALWFSTHPRLDAVITFAGGGDDVPPSPLGMRPLNDLGEEVMLAWGDDPGEPSGDPEALIAATACAQYYGSLALAAAQGAPEVPTPTPEETVGWSEFEAIATLKPAYQVAWFERELPPGHADDGLVLRAWSGGGTSGANPWAVLEIGSSIPDGTSTVPSDLVPVPEDLWLGMPLFGAIVVLNESPLTLIEVQGDGEFVVRVTPEIGELVGRRTTVTLTLDDIPGPVGPTTTTIPSVSTTSTVPVTTTTTPIPVDHLIPELIGLTEAEARQALAESAPDVGIVVEEEILAAGHSLIGTVTRSSHLPGCCVTPGETITLWVGVAGQPSELGVGPQLAVLWAMTLIEVTTVDNTFGGGHVFDEIVVDPVVRLDGGTFVLAEGTAPWTEFQMALEVGAPEVAAVTRLNTGGESIATAPDDGMLRAFVTIGPFDTDAMTVQTSLSCGNLCGAGPEYHLLHQLGVWTLGELTGPYPVS